MPWTKDNGVKVQKVSFILRVKLRIFACVLGNNHILIYLKYLHLVSTYIYLKYLLNHSYITPVQNWSQFFEFQSLSYYCSYLLAIFYFILFFGGEAGGGVFSLFYSPKSNKLVA